MRSRRIIRAEHVTGRVVEIQSKCERGVNAETITELVH